MKNGRLIDSLLQVVLFYENNLNYKLCNTLN